jgi:adenosylhomocysteinase
MDGSFSLQALGAGHLAQHGRSMGPGVHAMPAEIDARVARYALASLGISIDRLTTRQRAYLAAYGEGT